MNGQSIDTVIEQNPPRPVQPPATEEQFSVLGVKIDNVTRARAMELLENVILRAAQRALLGFFRQRRIP